MFIDFGNSKFGEFTLFLKLFSSFHIFYGFNLITNIKNTLAGSGKRVFWKDRSLDPGIEYGSPLNLSQGSIRLQIHHARRYGPNVGPLVIHSPAVLEFPELTGVYSLFGVFAVLVHDEFIKPRVALLQLIQRALTHDLSFLYKNNIMRMFEKLEQVGGHDDRLSLWQQVLQDHLLEDLLRDVVVQGW